MIRIDTSKIEKWEEIKEKHYEWCKNQIKEQIEFFRGFLKDDDYKKEIEFYDKYILYNLKSIILSENIKEEILDGLNNKYFEINNELKGEIDIEFLNEGIELLNTKIQKDNKSKRIEKIKKFLDEYEKNKLIFPLKTKFKKINKECNLGKINSIREELKKEIKNQKKHLSNFKGRINSIFDYNSFTKEKPDNWGRRKLLNMLGLETCPYCQRAYVTNFEDKDGENNSADLDHFYPKAKYPYLALSLYNFIPSCKFCNSTGRKGEVDTFEKPHIYPYTDSMEEDIKFTIKVDSAVDTLFIENKKLEIGIDVNIISKEGIKDEDRKEKIDNSLKTFKLKEVYKNSHSNYVGDLIHNFQKYPKSYTKALGEIFIDKPQENKNVDKSECEEEKNLIKLKEYEEKLKIINDNFQEIIKKPYVDRIEKGEPLAKLTKDIMDELGIK